MPKRRREDEDDDPAWSIPSLREPRYSQSLERGLAILESFTPEQPVLGIADIADSLGMSRSTTHRYVTTLVALGYVEQGARRKYRLGLRVTDLGMSALNATGLRQHGHADLSELARSAGYTTSLAVLDGEEILYVNRARGIRRRQRTGAEDPEPGSRLPAYCTALGKVLLAYLPEHKRRELLSGIALERRGPNTITSKSDLSEELAQIADEGFAVEDRESSPRDALRSLRRFSTRPARPRQRSTCQPRRLGSCLRSWPAASARI